MLKWILSFVIVFLVATIIIFSELDLMLNELARQPHISLDSVKHSIELQKKFALNGQSTPQDFGYFSNKVSEVRYNAHDGHRLSGWFVDLNPSSTKCILLVHPPGYNRLLMLKYLEIFRENHQNYNLFFIDLRNSGNSNSFDDDATFYTHKDLMASIFTLAEHFEQKSFSILAIGESALSAALMAGNNIFQKELKERKLELSHIILESPLCDFKSLLEETWENYPKTLQKMAMWLLGRKLRENINNMRLSNALKSLNCEVMIMQNVASDTPGTEYLLKEISNVRQVKLTIFDGDTLNIFKEIPYRKKYSTIINNFLS